MAELPELERVRADLQVNHDIEFVRCRRIIGRLSAHNTTKKRERTSRLYTLL